ncbi:MAG: UvrD-helicase domain-containing protein, partial [Clostridia bacterium]|nr:UvrD-helicase domain-containing protein [Clostridia bacterium]
MSKIQFTPRQEQAICGRGHSLLVSAAAGSGKTAVLVERVLRYLAERQGDIRRLIIMTFTEAAAAEMRQKIKKAVDSYLRENGGNDHLMLQSTLIDGAQIGTIHSICRSLITAHFEQLELDPRCRLLDETSDAAMIEEEAEALLEELFGREDEDVRFLLDCYAAGREDDTLKSLLIRGLAFLEKQPLPEEYIKRTLAPYDRGEEGLFACFAEDGLYTYISNQLQELQMRYLFLIRRVERHPSLSAMPLLSELLEEDHRRLCKLSEVLDKRDYDGFLAALNSFKFATLSWKKLNGGVADEAAQEMLTEARQKCKDAFSAFKKSFTAPESAELERIACEGRLLRAYLTACTELKERLGK